jgi:tetratricopeptide (TPR) repeat protein
MQKLHLPTLLIIALLFLFSSKTEAQSAKKLIKEAQSFYALQNYNDALTKLGEALQLESGNEDALFLRGKVYQAKNECAKAIADFQSAASKMPKNAELFDSMAHCQAELGSNNDALISIDRVIQLSPKNLSYRHFKMSILMNQRKFDQTVATADQALLVDKEDDYSFYLKANAVDSLGNTALAETYFAKALSLALDDKAKKQNGSLLHPYYIGLANSQKKLFKKQIGRF